MIWWPRQMPKTGTLPRSCATRSGAADEPGRVLCAAHEPLGVQIDARQHRLLRAVVAEVAHQRARVDTLDRGDAVAGEVRAQALLGAPGGRRLAVLAHHEAAHVGA